MAAAGDSAPRGWEIKRLKGMYTSLCACSREPGRFFVDKSECVSIFHVVIWKRAIGKGGGSESLILQHTLFRLGAIMK